MSEEKEIFGTEPENTENEVVEEVEAVVEETEEVVEEVAEETAEEVVEEAVEAPQKKVLSKVYACDACGAICENEVCDACGKELTEEDAYVCKSAVAVAKAKKRNKTIATVIAAIVAAVVVVWGGLYIYREVYNPYNHAEEYKDLAFGDTLADFTETNGMTLKQLLEANGLPKNMSKSTYVNIAQQYTPVKFMAEQYGMTVQDYADQMQVEGEFDEDVTIGELQGEATVEVIFGVDEEGLAEFKEQYKLDDSVTLETKFKDVRAAVMKAQYEEYQAMEKEAEEKEAEEKSAEETAETAPETEEKTEEAK